LCADRYELPFANLILALILIIGGRAATAQTPRRVYVLGIPIGLVPTCVLCVSLSATVINPIGVVVIIVSPYPSHHHLTLTENAVGSAARAKRLTSSRRNVRTNFSGKVSLDSFRSGNGRENEQRRYLRGRFKRYAYSYALVQQQRSSSSEYSSCRLTFVSNVLLFHNN